MNTTTLQPAFDRIYRMSPGYEKFKAAALSAVQSSSASGLSLTDAVSSVLKTAGMGTENEIRRVSELANQFMFDQRFSQYQGGGINSVEFDVVDPSSLFARFRVEQDKQAAMGDLAHGYIAKAASAPEEPEGVCWGGSVSGEVFKRYVDALSEAADQVHTLHKSANFYVEDAQKMLHSELVENLFRGVSARIVFASVEPYLGKTASLKLVGTAIEMMESQGHHICKTASLVPTSERLQKAAKAFDYAQQASVLYDQLDQAFTQIMNQFGPTVAGDLSLIKQSSVIQAGKTIGDTILTALAGAAAKEGVWKGMRKIPRDAKRLARKFPQLFTEIDEKTFHALKSSGIKQPFIKEQVLKDGTKKHYKAKGQLGGLLGFVGKHPVASALGGGAAVWQYGRDKTPTYNNYGDDYAM